LPLPPVSRFSTRRSQQETPGTKKEHGKEAAPIDAAAVTSHSPSLPNHYTAKQEDTLAQVRAEPAPVEETSPTTTTPEPTPILEEPTEEPSSSASHSVAAPKTEDATVLPPGWVQRFTDAPDPLPYYLYEPDGTTQWERPSVPQVVPPASVEKVVEPWLNEAIVPPMEPRPHETADVLPDGWVQCYTTDASPVPYYLYQPDGTTQWERPAVEGPVPPVGDAEHKDPPVEEVVAPVVEKAAPHHAEPEGWLPPCPEEKEPYYVDAPADGTTPWTTAARMPEWEGEGPVERSAAEAPMPAAATPPPEEDMERSSEAPLPVGWVALWTEEKEPYYLYAPDGTTQWDRPTADPPSAEPPHALPESTATAEPEAVLPPN
jgi:WW domain